MKKILLGSIILLLTMGTGELNSNPVPRSIRHLPEITWDHLEKMKKFNLPTNYLKNLNGKKVRIAGFIVPLDEPQDFESFIEAQEFKIGEFLLVPGMGMCMHVPPPPPNQMVRVKMQKGKNTKFSWDPMWIVGTFRIKKGFSPFGNPFFQLEGEQALKYD